MNRYDYARQAIVTKYLGPTAYKGSRIKATCNAKSLNFAWKPELDTYANHLEAALSLAEQLNWTKRHDFAGGSLPNNKGYCFVAVPKLKTKGD